MPKREEGQLSRKEKIRLCTGGDFWHTRALRRMFTSSFRVKYALL